MTDFSEFIGTWRADREAPYSSHTFTWQPDDSGLLGRWIVEAADSPAIRAAAAATGRPTRFEMQVGQPWLEDDLLLFYVNGGPVATEFRLLSRNEAVVGAAVHKLPPELSGPEHRESIEGHRVRLTRKPETTV